MAQELRQMVRRGNAIRRIGRVRLILLITGIACLIAGILVILGPLLGVWQRSQFDQQAINSWLQNGTPGLTGAQSGPSSLDCGSNSSANYALVQFGQPAADHYAGVAGDGDWSELSQRSMVHYHGTPAPGARGNMIIAFHREPNYPDVNQMGVGAIVTVQDRSCRTFKYRITHVWVENPQNVSQLVPTSGYNLTLITCTPYWQDYQRIVWRADLVTS